MHVNLSTTRIIGGWMYSRIDNDNYLLLSSSGQFIKHLKPLVAQSGDRLKENEIFVDSACATLAK